jgi:large subunit ribosomal protein L22
VTGPKTNERPGTRAQVKFSRMSAYKAREVLDLIRGKDVDRAAEILQFSERDAAIVIRKCLMSAIANAEHNDGIPADELYVSACYADEGVTIKRWRPRARGRATRIRKRTCHITVIVSRMSEDQLERRRAKEAARPGSRAARTRGSQAAEERRRRVARSRRGHDHAAHEHEHEPAAAPEAPEAEAPAVEVPEAEVPEAEAPEVEAPEAEAEAGAEAVTPDTASTPGSVEGDDEQEEGEK